MFQTSQRTRIKRQRHTTTDQSTDNLANSQNFFQSFAPLFGNTAPIGHSRPLLYPEHSFKPSYKSANYRELPFTGVNDNILGSGNFGVVKGGTYYAEEREDADFASDSEPYAYIGPSSDGGSRLHRRKNPPPAFRNGGDFFAHFRDFADITAPSKSFSQYYVVYVNKNATIEDGINAAAATATATSVKKPKNIIEQLNMLDEEAENEEPLRAHESKQSKFKRKLSAHQNRERQKEINAKSKLYSPVKEIPEPLLALS